MTFQQLSFVVEVANCESINKAAERLYTSQSNVSNSIKALEEELGIQIFLRTKKGVSVTEEGREFLSYANEIIDKKIFVEDLYAKYPDVASLAAAEPEEIEAIVRPCGLGKSKARDISACMRILHEQYADNVPTTFEELLKLPGVGRKSANLIMGDVFGKPAIVTDTHCIRLVNRMGLVKDIKEPKKVEMELWKIIPPEEGNDFCHRLVEHGRDVCTARTNPHCDRCVLNDICATGKKLMKAEQKTK